MVAFGPGVGGVWKSLEKQTRENFTCYKQSLMKNSAKRSEDQSAHRNVDSKGQAHDISDGNKDSTVNWTRGLQKVTFELI
jgi:hypothetical protein